MSFILSKMNNIFAVAKANSSMCVNHTENKWIATFAVSTTLQIARNNTNGYTTTP